MLMRPKRSLARLLASGGTIAKASFDAEQK